MYTNDADSSLGRKVTDTLIDTYTLESPYHITISEYEIDDSMKRSYIASFEHAGVHYQIKAIIDKDELEKILKSLYVLE